MKENFVVDYVNENEFHKLERSLKKYNMLAYKKLYFEYYPKIKEGVFLGELKSQNKEKNTENYELRLPTDSLFAKVHGYITLHYTIYKSENLVMLNTITPEDILTEGHQSELETYKGVMVSKEHSDKDIFKINLLNSMNKNGFLNISKKTLIILSLIFIAIVALVIYLIIK